MATMTYKEQLFHPNWQKKRLQIMQRDEFRCQYCMDDESTLHVHHKQYGKGRLAWEYPDDELVTLCEQCHEVLHEQQGELRNVTAKLPVDGPGCLSNGTSVLAGWAHDRQGMDFGHVFQDDPHNFVCGQVASYFDDKLNLNDLLGLLDAVRNAPRWVVSDAIRAFARSCHERRNEPPPPAVMGKTFAEFQADL